MKRVIKRTAAVVLAITVLCGTVAGSYQNAQASGIVAGGAIVGTLEEILLSFGIFLLPSAMADQAQSSDWWYSEDGNAALKPYYDDLASEYEKERFKVINGGGGDPQPSPTPVPEQKPEIQPTPVPEVKPGEIPTFDELVAPALAGGAISWASGAWDTMAKAVGNLWDKIFGTVSDVPKGLTQDEVNVIVNSGCCYYYTYEATSSYYGSDYIRVYHLGGIGSYLQGSTISSAACGVRAPYKLIYPSCTQEGNTSGLFGGKYGYNQRNFFTNMPLFSSSAEVDQWRVQQLANADKYTKENIWVHPDLQNTYQNNGKFEYPAQAPQPLQYPSAENLADLAKKLNPEINPDYSPEIAPNYVQELIQKLQKDPSVNPDPNPNPNPDPNPNPNPDPDNPETPTPEEEASPYKADIREIFPFCIPFDLIHLLKVFEADAEAPVFEFPLDIELDNPWTGKKVVDYHHTFELDMSDYEPVIKILRIFQVVFFIIALMLITRQQMIKG